MSSSLLLTIVLYLPLLGALALLALPKGDGVARAVGLGVSGVNFILSLGLWAAFDPHAIGFQAQTRLAWLGGGGVTYHTGVDGISLLFVILSTLLVPVSILAGWRIITQRVRDYMVALLLLETALVGLFSSLDLVLFYVFYEATLIPGALLIGIWGGPGRIAAATRFFLFTFGGSLFMLLDVVYLWQAAGTTDLPVLMGTHFAPAVQAWLFAGFVLAFGVKLPIFPLHGWLPSAYGEAPAPVTALLSGVLAKAGAYGLLRFAILLLPDAAHRFAPVLIALGIVAVIYAAVIALAQSDMKQVIAWSSYSHMGIVAIGLFTLNAEGIDGALFQMLAHGIVIAGMFLALGMLSLRTGTRELAGFGGAAGSMPKLALLTMLFAMAGIGLPGTAGFVGELLVIAGAIHIGFWTALLAGSGMILGAIYMLILYWRSFFGVPRGALAGAPATSRDIGAVELAALVPLALIVLWMGVYPTKFTQVFNPRVMAFAHPEAVASIAPATRFR